MFILARLAARHRWLVGGAAAAVVLTGSGVATAAVAGYPVNPFGQNRVGQAQADGRILLNDNQWVAPYGQRTQLPGELNGIAVSPDGTKVAAQVGGLGGAQELGIVDAATGQVVQSVGAPAAPGLPGGLAEGPPVYSPDGTTLYAAAGTANTGVAGPASILKYAVGPDGLVTDPTSPQMIGLSSQEYPFGMAVSADGTKLYATLSGANELGVIDTTTDQVVNRIPVGNAPQGVVIVGNQAFVSNRGGRRAVAGDTTNNSDGTAIVSNPVTGASATGTVSVVNLATDTVTGTINVGLQPASLTAEGDTVFVTNTNSDTVSVIDAASHKVMQTFNVEPLPGSTVGASPNSVSFAGPHTLLVSVGRDNALAVYTYNGPRTPVRYEGLIPTDWYPAQVQYDAQVGRVIVSNTRGIGTNGDTDVNDSVKGTVTSFSMPSNLMLGNLTHQVFANNGWDHLAPSKANASSRRNGNKGPLPAIPARLGQPSAIKHVFLVIKENRTYDQVLGDIGKGNSDPDFTDFGAQVTPNEHSLANTFTLFDNFYDAGDHSADGHQWLTQGDANDYMEQEAASVYERSYPYPGGDALAYQRDGFLWNTVEAAHKTVRNYGEFESITSGKEGTSQQYWDDAQILEGKASGPLPVPLDQFQSRSDVPSLNTISNPDYPRFDLSIPDQYRVDVWEQDFRHSEQTGQLPGLTIIQLPGDHGVTSEVADNDLAFGRIVSDISHSRFWKDSAIFGVEDDTASGADHVDGHRGPLWIASPYARRGVIDSDYFTQVNVVKTIEQILGAQPMNQMDRAAVPMFSAFTSKPDFTPYQTLPNQVPLEFPSAGSTTTPAAATAVPAAERSVAAAWASWYKTQALPHLAGPRAQPDSVNFPQFNRYDWYTATGWSKPYPGDKEILAPGQVPGRNLPGGFLGD